MCIHHTGHFTKDMYATNPMCASSVRIARPAACKKSYKEKRGFVRPIPTNFTLHVAAFL